MATNILKRLTLGRYHIILFLLFLILVFTRSYQFEQRNQFTWDQVDNAWMAKNIIVDHKFPLVGMEAKKNSGFYIGPLYYYFITPFYLLSNLDPIASFYIALVSNIITFFVLFYVFKKMFSIKFALIAIFIYTFSSTMIIFDKIQWPVNYIVPLSVLIFYALYRIIIGEVRYILWLFALVGLSLQINFTSIFYSIIIILTLPFFPWNKNTIKYILISVPIFLLFLIPNFVYELLHRGSSSLNLSYYLNTYYHGFHIKRLIQIAKDAFISIEEVLSIPFLKFFNFLLLPIFLLIYNLRNKSRKTLTISYLVTLWFLVPWFVFSLYRGEISNYYFSQTIPIAILILTFLTVEIFSIRNVFAKLVIFGFWIYYGVFNFVIFYNTKLQGLAYHRAVVKEHIRNGRVVNFVQGDPESYIYYYYKRK